MPISEQTTIEIADKVLMHFRDHDMTNQYFPFINAGFPEAEIEDGQHARTMANVIRLLEEHLGYIAQYGSSGDWYVLTQKGLEVKQAGGHFSYLKQQEEKAQKERSRQHLNDEKLTYDVKNSKRIFKTYWWTFWISIAAFLIALTNLIYNLFYKQ